MDDETSPGRINETPDLATSAKRGRPAGSAMTHATAGGVLAAAVNAVVLFLVGLYILYEPHRRFSEPAEVQTGLTLAVATVAAPATRAGMASVAAACTPAGQADPDTSRQQPRGHGSDP